MEIDELWEKVNSKLIWSSTLYAYSMNILFWGQLLKAWLELTFG